MRKKRAVSDVYKKIDVPFEFIGLCFYCGELANEYDHVPPASRYYDWMATYDCHKPLIVPCCSSCNKLLSNELQKDIYHRYDVCKEKLNLHLSKFLKYEDIWWDGDFEYAGFTGNFKKFAESMVDMVAYAKSRCDWEHWPVSVDGESVDRLSHQSGYSVDGKKFNYIDDLYSYVKKKYGVNRQYLIEVVELLGISKLEYAIRICTTNKATTRKEVDKVLNDLRDELNGKI